MKDRDINIGNIEPAQRAQLVAIDYTDYLGGRASCVVLPIGLRFGATGWRAGAGEQWLLDAWDVEKRAYRTFAVKDIHSWGPDMSSWRSME